MQTVFALLSMLGLFGMGISFVWIIIRFITGKAVKPALKSLGASFAVMIISVIIFSEVNPELKAMQEADKKVEASANPKGSDNTPKNTESISQSPRDSFIEQLTANSDVTKEAAESTYDILTADMGFENIEYVDNPSGTLFEVKADNCNLKITVSDKLYMVICGGYNMYEEDTIKYTRQDIEDRSLNGKESYYYTIAQEIVSNNLKSPKTADFPSIIWSPSDIGMARNKDLVVVQSYVDAQNSFGALVRSKFTVQFRVIDLDSFSYETTYINIDGSESGEYINMD